MRNSFQMQFHWVVWCFVIVCLHQLFVVVALFLIRCGKTFARKCKQVPCFVILLVRNLWRKSNSVDLHVPRFRNKFIQRRLDEPSTQPNRHLCMCYCSVFVPKLCYRISICCRWIFNKINNDSEWGSMSIVQRRKINILITNRFQSLIYR